MTMNCEQFNELLMDLAYGELPEGERTGLMAHADGCKACREALDGVMITRRMAASLDTMEPPDTLDAAVMAMAATVQPPEPMSASVVKQVDGPGFFEQLHRLLFKPAIATAGLAAAIAGTLFLLHREEAPSLLNMRSDGAPFEGPARLAEENAATAADPLTDAAGAAPAASPAPAEAIVADDRPAGATESGRRARSVATGSAGSGTAADQKSARPSPAGAGNGAARDYDILGAAEAPAEKKKDASTPFASAPDPGAADDMAEGRSEEVSSAPVKKAPSAIVPGSASAPKSAPISRSASFTSGLEAYNRGNCPAATADFQNVLNNSSSPAGEIPAANHYIARCEARMGRCGKAILYYDAVISRYPGYGDRPAALYEAADCQRKLGNANRARVLLEELRSFPAWTARADARLQELDTAKTKATY